ncbi:YwdI family protein [Sediminibacillus albus]|uniref:YwdI family protein n=1 Tax=Sediminibacillus albus TaxID=407036 RepID=A0A1G8ZQA7_9BACI|nr:YwdI family protein [Sediminibacillus albus]SDK16350.1 hypothetical protein SAMN05216243_2113 [Sediminibacillus albus]
MAITNQAVLRKMGNELQEALAKQDQTEAVREHVRAVRLLCDLILDDGQGVTEEQELAKMMGGVEGQLPSSKPTPGRPQKNNINHEEANGNSIFDF